MSITVTERRSGWSEWRSDKAAAYEARRPEWLFPGEQKVGDDYAQHVIAYYPAQILRQFDEWLFEDQVTDVQLTLSV